MKFRYVLFLLVAGLATPGSVFAGGVTVMTHGFNSDVEGWILPMADRYTERPEFPGNDISCYIIKIEGSDAAYTTTVNRVAGPAPDESDSGEIFVKLDWSSISTANSTSSTEVAIPAAAALLSTTLIPENGGRALAELPMHLLGHSRGSSVVSEIARLLGDDGVWVDQLTLWDPVDTTFDDATIGIWDNVLFADNYYQQFGQFLIPQGRSVAGCYNRKLTDLPSGYAFFSGGHHSDVHAWYHGTVELGAEANDGNIDITNTMRENWYVDDESDGALAGFHYSRIGGGDRLSNADPADPPSGMISDGYHSLLNPGLNLPVNRESLPTPGNPWPNVIIARRTSSDPLEGGKPLPLELRYQSVDTSVGDPVLTLLLDPDPNPWNGNEIPFFSETLNGSGFDDIFTATLAPLLPPAIDGSFFLHTRLSENGRTRYLNLRDPLQITAAPLPPHIVPGSLRFEEELFTFTLSGTIGDDIMIQSSPDLDDWSTIETITLASAQQDFSDPNSDEYAVRFYRIGIAP